MTRCICSTAYDKGYNAGYSFHGRMLALAQVEGMLAVVDDELYGKSV